MNDTTLVATVYTEHKTALPSRVSAQVRWLVSIGNAIHHSDYRKRHLEILSESQDREGFAWQSTRLQLHQSYEVRPIRTLQERSRMESIELTESSYVCTSDIISCTFETASLLCVGLERLASACLTRASAASRARRALAPRAPVLFSAVFWAPIRLTVARSYSTRASAAEQAEFRSP